MSLKEYKPWGLRHCCEVKNGWNNRPPVVFTANIPEMFKASLPEGNWVLCVEGCDGGMAFVEVFYCPYCAEELEIPEGVNDESNS